MSGYELTRQWWDFSFENQDIVSAKHCALYMWIIEKNNRLGWVEKFGFPMDEAGAAIGIKKIQTVREALNDLETWGFVQFVIRSTNQWQSNVISIINCRVESGNCLDQTICLTEKRSSTDQAQGQARVEHQVNQGVEHGSGTVPIDKPINQQTNKPINQQTDDADRVGEMVSGTEVEEKIEPPSKVAPKVSPSLHAQVKALIESLNPGYYWQAKDGKAAKALIQKIKHRWQNKHGTEATDEDVVTSLNWMLSRLPEWYRDKWDTTVIESKFESIVKQITEEQKNGKSGKIHGNDSPTGTGVSSRLQRTWELLAESRKAGAS